MKPLTFAKKILHRRVGSFHIAPATPIRAARSGLARTYADWRVGATHAEKRSYKTSESILFTFDDYGSTNQVMRLLGILEQENIKAAFFLQGNWAIQNPQLVEAIRKAGHVIGNHTYSHQDLLSLTDEQVRSEIANGPKSEWLRPPRGRFDARIREIARQYDQRICYWSLDSDDWKAPDQVSIARKVLSGIHPGAVILFHLHSDVTIGVLPELIPAIRARGLTITSPDEPYWGRGK